MVATKGIKDEFANVLVEIWRDTKSGILDKAKREAQFRFEQAHARFLGCSVSVIGPPCAGKTTLLRVLREPLVSEEELVSYAKTEVEEFAAFKAKFLLPVGEGRQVDFHFRVQKNVDVGGEEYLKVEHWAQVITGADVVVYLADASRLIEGDEAYRARVISDFDWLFDNVQRLNPNFSVVLAANKVDLLSDRAGFREFAEQNTPVLQALKEEISGRWGEGYRGNLKGTPFLSLTEPGLRGFTLKDLIASFVGDSLLDLYRERS